MRGGGDFGRQYNPATPSPPSGLPAAGRHELLDLNGEGRLTATQKRELVELMRIHDVRMLKKALGWAEAVRRKLRPRLSPGPIR